MSITAKELAKILQLSEASVSFALNGKPGVSAKTRNRVLEAAKKHGYDSTQLHNSYDSGKTICFIVYKKSGAVVSDTPFFSALTEGIASGCKKGGYTFHISYLYEDENLLSQINQLKGGGYAGMILLATEMNLQSLRFFSDIIVPVVVLDSYFESLQYSCVLINNAQGAFTAVDYLISKCRCQPGYLHSSYSISNFEERADGFYKAVRKHGMSTSKSIVHRLTPSQEGAYMDMKALITSGEELASCYFADNDLIAMGAMKALIEAGYAIPGDISIIGFDNMPFCEYSSPALTTVDVPKQYMGETAVVRLIQIMERGMQLPVKIEVGTSLKKRKSVRAARMP